ncbi:Crp/Fnr family transcriptional regulator [Burkholderia sp. Bp9126]|nr:Crp/Fnr family transcriptional regulator [Burkholderia sp. Bp9126]
MNTQLANHLLASLPESEFDALAPHLQLVQLRFGQLLSDAGETVKKVYFPTSSIISMIFLMADGATAEVAAVGNEGVVGVPALTGGFTMPNRIEVRNSGYAYAMNAQLFKREFDRHGFIHRLMLYYIQALLTQVAQSSLCNRRHHIARQVSSWLLLTQDRLKTHELAVTQQLIATMLGVRREGVTEAAGKLQDAGLISQRRGKIIIIDRDGLEEYACECYGIVKREFQRLLRANAAENSADGNTRRVAEIPSSTQGSYLAHRICSIEC